MKNYIFLFSGQGSQYYHMGEELFENNPIFRKWMLKLDDETKKIANRSIIEFIYDSNKKMSDDLDDLNISHLAIFMIEYSLAQLLIEEGITPKYVVGMSLGEIVALAVSGKISYVDAIKYVNRQAGVIVEKCGYGNMIAILDNYHSYYENEELYGNSEIAAINYDNHYIISCCVENYDKIVNFLKDNLVVYMKLPVRYAFHSKYIDEAEIECKKIIKNITFNEGSIKIASCYYGGMLKEVDENYVWNVVRKKMKIGEIIIMLENNNIGENVYIDVGPSGSFSNIVKNNIKEGKSNTEVMLSPFSKDRNINKLIEKYRTNRKENKKLKTYVFPGQGSQYKGMGKDLFDEFNEYVEITDRVLNYSIKNLCLNDEGNKLSDTRYTQVAIYVVSALTYLKEVKTNGYPDYVAGHSVGEYAALFASGVLSFEDGLRLIAKRGELMSKAKDGSMAAIIGIGADKVAEIIDNNNLNKIDIANINSPIQTVISSEKEEIINAEKVFLNSGANRYVILNVGGAFHSRYMREVADEFKIEVENINFNKIKIPVISNVTARPYKDNEFKDLLVKQLVNPVKWTETIRYLNGKGKMEYKELGPGKVLTGLIIKINDMTEPLIEKDEEIKETVIENSMLVDEKSNSNICEKVVEKEEEVIKINNNRLGSKEFKDKYNIKYAYVVGGMRKGISSKEMVARLAKNNILGFLGSCDMELHQLDEDIKYLKGNLDNRYSYGVNVTYQPQKDDIENKIFEILLKNNIRIVELGSYIGVSKAAVMYRLRGLKKDKDGNLIYANKIFLKASREEVVKLFLKKPSQKIIDKLLFENKITEEEAVLGKEVVMIDEIIVCADCASKNEGGNISVLLPQLKRVTLEISKKYGLKNKIHVGAAGGIGIPDSAVAAFVLGADFIETGSINQCTEEAGTSSIVKDILQDISGQDTDNCPYMDMFEMNVKCQVVKKGMFFSVRANRLFDIYRQNNSIDTVSGKNKTLLEDKILKKSIEGAVREIKNSFVDSEYQKIINNSKLLMSTVFKTYLEKGFIDALEGKKEEKVNFQVFCSQAMGAFNSWKKGTAYESWHNRHADEIASLIMDEAEKMLLSWINYFVKQ